MWKILFGKENQPQVLRQLSQRGQNVFKQTIKIVGSKGEIKDIRVLGGFRAKTQVELTEAEALALGIKPVWRLSGKVSNSAGCKLIGSAGRAKIKTGVIVPIPHLHLNPKEAEQCGLNQGQEIEIGFVENKETKIKVVVRVHPSFRAALHITPDLAAKIWPSPTEKAILENQL